MIFTTHYFFISFELSNAHTVLSILFVGQATFYATCFDQPQSTRTRCLHVAICSNHLFTSLKRQVSSEPKAVKAAAATTRARKTKSKDEPAAEKPKAKAAGKRDPKPKSKAKGKKRVRDDDDEEEED